MFGRENINGILLLILCGVVSIIMINAIITGETPTVPENLRAPFTVAGVVLMAVMLWQWLSKRFRGK